MELSDNKIIYYLRKICLSDFILAVAFIIASVILQFAQHDNNFIPSVNFDINEKQHTSTVPEWFHYGFIFVICPIVLVLSWFSVSQNFTIYRVLSSFFFNVCFSSFIASLFAYLIGRPRPDTIAKCGGEGSYVNCLGALNSRELAYQFRSMPSVTICEIVSACGYLAFFFFDVNQTTTLYSTFLKFVPLLFAFLEIAAEIWDRKCHVDDALFASFISCLVTFVSYTTFRRGIKNSPQQMSAKLRSQSDMGRIITSYV